jgi:CheY-like chemotaxis protein
VRILVIEDDDQKLGHIVKFAEEHFVDPQIDEAKSFAGGRAKLLSHNFDLVLLDMTLPVFDVTPTETGYETMFFAGRDLLREMSRKEIVCPTIVVTQFEQFGENEDRMTLQELTQQLSEQFSGNYVGTVYYHPSQDDWQGEIVRLLPEKLQP